LVVHLFDLGPDHVKIVSNTVGAIADCVGNSSAACVTVIACSHVAGCELLVAGYWLLDTGYWILDTG
jgi:hypothetical protein